MDLESHATFAQLPDHVKPAWLRAVRALPPIWLIAPDSGEVFNRKGHCLERLQGWDLFQGFAVVTGRV
jgi:hypothetical protein